MLPAAEFKGGECWGGLGIGFLGSEVAEAAGYWGFGEGLGCQLSCEGLHEWA